MKKTIVACMLIIAGVAILGAQTTTTSPKPLPRDSPVAEKLNADGAKVGNQSVLSNVGLIISTPSLFSDFASYRAGVGLKVLGKQLDYRFGGDVFLTNASNLISFDLSVFLENHFWDGQVSPYWGGGLDVGLMTSGSVSTEDPTTWNRELLIPASISTMFGVEFFLLDFLSLFVEYELSFNFNTTINMSSVSDVRINTSSYEYYLDSKLGNQGSIGIVIYLGKRLNPKK